MSLNLILVMYVALMLLHLQEIIARLDNNLSLQKNRLKEKSLWNGFSLRNPDFNVLVDAISRLGLQRR